MRRLRNFAICALFVSCSSLGACGTSATAHTKTSNIEPAPEATPEQSSAEPSSDVMVVEDVEPDSADEAVILPLEAKGPVAIVDRV